jgi:predicted acylesterase/phospholipase RssA/CRP-like cAMP-binding protein
MSQTIKEYLKIHVSTVGVPPSVLDEIAEVATLRKYARAENALTQGQSVDAVSLVVSGHFAICRDDECTNIVGGLGPNDLLGLLSVAHGQPAAMTITAMEPSLVIEIKSEDAQRLMASDRVFARNLVSRATSRMTQLIMDGGKPPTVRRVAFLHMFPPCKNVAEKVQARLLQLGESVGRFVTGQSPTDAESLSACPSLVISEDDPLSVIREQLAGWLQLDRVVFDIDFSSVDLRLEHLRQLLSFSERIFLVLTPECGTKVVPQLRAALAESPEWKDKISALWVLDENHDLAPLNCELRDLVCRDFKVKTGSANESFQHTEFPGIERVVHSLRGIRLGLALGGGAAKGMSHLGVLRALDEHGIVIDAIAGTSVGAMMGVPYCGGYSPDNTVERFTKALTPNGIYKWVTKGDLWYMLVKYRSKAWEGMLREHFFDWELQQLLIPLTTIATDLVSGSEFVRKTGDCVSGILESINLGGISMPICRDGMVLVDGGYLNNVPADTLVQDDATYVISVDVSSQIADSFGGNARNTPTADMKIPRINQVLSRIREVAQKNLSVMGGAQSDFTIAPDVSKVTFTDFKSTPQIADIGYNATLRCMAHLKTQLHELDPQLFPAPQLSDEQLL